MSTRVFLCKICVTNRSFNEFCDYFRHVTLDHANEPNFRLTCDISDSCGVMYKTFTSYKKHIHRHHENLLHPVCQQQENTVMNDMNTLAIQQPDATVIYPDTADNNHDNVIYADFNDDLDNQWNTLTTNISTNNLSSNHLKKEYSYHIPIRNTLEKILQKDEMIPLLIDNIQHQTSITHDDPDLMFSRRDGIKGKTFSNQSFLIQLYVDGIGVTNPIGPKKDQHKLTLVYFMLEDIPDIFRSTLQCINLAAICYTKYLNKDEKLRKFYDPIVNDLNDLQSTGLILNTFNSQLHFTFTTIAADNLAAHEIAGMQQTFSSGYFCRRCLVTYENRLIPLTDIHFIQRTHPQHTKCLQLLEKNPHIKSMYGVIGPSPLDNLINFDTTASLPGDVMHDYFEGVCPIIIMALLKEASNLKLITFAAIQERTENFSYGELDASNKPPPIQVKHLNNDRITGSAAQKFCLFRLFPIIFSDMVEHLKSFKIYLILREMLDIILALPQRKSWLPYLETLSINFQCMMLELLPDKATPKVHYATEYTKIIEENGPPLRYWCMRYEGAHLYFKKIAMQSYNFKNIPKTLAQRQQLRQCFLMSKCRFLKSYQEASGNKIIYMHEIDSKVKVLLNHRYGSQFIQSQTLLQCSQLIHNHVIYKQHAVYVYDLEHVEEIPVFFQIIHILKLNQEWIFVVDLLNTDGFSTKLWSYRVSSYDRLDIVSPNNIKYYHKGLDLYKEEVDGETLFYMNDLSLLKPFKLSYKNQIIFLKEREKLFSSKTNEKPTSSSTPNDTALLIIDENQQDDEHKNQSAETSINVSSIETIITTENLTEKSLPDPYLLPVLPSQVNDAINLKQMEKFEKLCNFRSIIIDAVFHDLKTNYGLIYPTREQYTTIVNGILNHLKIERDPKTCMLIIQGTPNEIQQIEEKVETIKTDLQNKSIDDPHIQRLWIETFDYRQNFIKQNTTVNIMGQFPVYSNPSMILADIELLSGVNLENSVKEKIQLLSNKICSGNKFLSDDPVVRCFKILCSILNDSWKHYICFYPEKPATPQPTMVIEENDIKIYVDWTFICSSNSMEQSLALVVGLYCLMNLTFPTYRSAVRFLYVYFMNDKQQQSNVIRKFCKVYNIQLQDNPSSSNAALLEETKINDMYLNDRRENNEEQNISFELQTTTSTQPTSMESTSHESTSIDSISTESISMEPISIESTPMEPIPTEPTTFQQRSNSKRKAEEKHDHELLSLETDSSKQKITRNLRSKRHKQ
ncbi:unnamed protein product [Rotaria sp. Silwood2]|nr:unnamed protein product [Rotaria sp. Silwood2]